MELNSFEEGYFNGKAKSVLRIKNEKSNRNPTPVPMANCSKNFPLNCEPGFNGLSFSNQIFPASIKTAPLIKL